MPKKEVVILDIGSSKMRVIIGDRGVNNTYNIIGFGEADYSGYADGKFLDEEELKYAIGMAISNAETNSGLQIREIYVGVPAEFSVATCKNVNQNFPKRTKINEDIINSFYAKSYSEELTNDYTLINCSPVFFVLGDNRRILSAINEKTNRLSALISCVYADNGFVELLNNILAEIGIEYVEYLSSPLSESQYLLGDDKKDKFALLIDCGYISTSICLVRGNGLLMLNSFSLGGGHISADLMEYLKIPYSSAESLKQKIVLSVNPSKTDTYEINVVDKPVPINMAFANQIVASRIEMISRSVNKCLSLCKQEYPEFIDVYLTGGGISYIKGAKDLLAKGIGRNIKLISPKDPQMCRPQYSSLLGLLEMSIKQKEKNKTSFLAKLSKYIYNKK